MTYMLPLAFFLVVFFLAAFLVDFLAAFFEPPLLAAFLAAFFLATARPPYKRFW